MEINKEIRNLIKFFKEKKIAISYTRTSIILSGIIILNKTDNDTSLYKEIYLKIEIPNSYPQKLPKVYDEKSILNKNYHINYNKSLCLGTDLDIRKILYPKYSLFKWMDDCVLPFLYASVYYNKYKISPFKERSHGKIGILESFSELFPNPNYNNLIFFIIKRKFIRNLKFKKAGFKIFCPCGSGKMISKCHKKEIEILKKIFYKKDLSFYSEIDTGGKF